MAFSAQHLPGAAAAAQLVLAGGGFMPARLLLAPVGARLPPGVHAVAVATVPATASSGSRAMGLVAHAAAGAGHGGVPVASLSILQLFMGGDSTGAAAGGPARGSAGGGGLRGDASAGFGFVISPAGRRASRGGGLIVAATAGSEAEGRDDNGSDSTKLGAFVVHDIITTQALDALWVLDDIVPATAKEQFAAKYTDVKTGLKKAVMLAQGRSNQMGVALEIMRGWYGIVELAYASYPNASMPLLPGEQAFLGRCLTADEPVILGQTVAPLIAPLQASNLLGREMPDSDVDLIRSIFIAVAVCQAAAKTARANYVSGEPNI